VVAVTTLVASLGLPQIITRIIARRGSVLKIVKTISWPLIIMAVLTNFGLGLYLFFFNGLSEWIVLIAAVVLSMSQVLWMILESFAFGKQQMEFSSILGSASSLVWLLFVFMIPHAHFSLTLIVAGFSTIQLLRSLAYGILEQQSGYFRKNNNSSEIENSEERRSIFLQSFPLFGTGLLSLLTTQIPIMFLGHFSGAKEVGYYGIGNKLMMPLMTLTNMLIAAAYPLLSKHYVDNRDQFNKYVRKLFLAIPFIGIIFGLTIGLFSKEIVVLVFGKNFSPAIEPFFIQIWIILIIVSLSFIASLFLATNNENLMVKLSIFNGLVIGGSSYVGSHYGAIGLAVGSLISFVVGFSLHWYFLNKLIGRIFQPLFLISIVVPFFILSMVGFLFINTSLPLRIVIMFGILTLFVLFHKKSIMELFCDLRAILSS
jgi:O-antigen/teichoic acid export membrane protein